MKVETYEQACALLKEPALDLSALPLSMQAAVKLRTIVKAINEERVMDYSNWDQKKWASWWDLENISLLGVHCGRQYSFVPPFLFFFDRKELEWSLEQHKELWTALFNPNEI